MDSYRGNLVRHEPADLGPYDSAQEPGSDLADDDDFAREPPPVSVGQNERRMQVRAYNVWASLLGDRPLPRIADLADAPPPDFADHAVVLDFSQGIANPAITMLGTKLAEECGAATIARISDVPEGSLLSRITDRYKQISAHAAPVGFEAEFINQRGKTLLYRGILLPFSDDGENIAHVMGVINWKELADPVMTAGLRQELESAVAAAHLQLSSLQLPAWADGPVAIQTGVLDADSAGWDLDDPLASARDAAEAARDAQERARAALYTAVGRAWDLALAAQADPMAFPEMLVAAGSATPPRAPIAAVVKLVFGAAYHKHQLAEIALVLAHARRLELLCGGLPEFLAGTPGGLKSIIREERRARRAEAGHQQQIELAHHTRM